MNTFIVCIFLFFIYSLIMEMDIKNAILITFLMLLFMKLAGIYIAALLFSAWFVLCSWKIFFINLVYIYKIIKIEIKYRLGDEYKAIKE